MSENRGLTMREILFRGKWKNSGEWVYGNLFNPDKADTPTQICIGTYIAKTCYEIDPETVGQYTGLTDKNGVRIFEGDIVKTHYANAQKSDFIEQVVFHNGKFCAYFSNQLCKQWANLYDGTEHLPQDKSVYMDSVEVIGNIHDNPELIETAAKPADKNIAQSTLAPATENFELMEG